MMDPHDDLEQQLTGLTQWTGGRTNLWKAADQSKLRLLPKWPPRLNRPVVAGLVLVTGIAAVLVITFFNDVRYSALSKSALESAPLDWGTAVHPGNRSFSFRASRVPGPSADSDGAGVIEAESPPIPDQPARRFVIQNGTVDLLSKDVSAAFLKVQQLVHPEAGEYVENSSLSGDAENAQANLTLRVASNRLDDVLNELRKLGKVQSEHLGGRDVTAEVVDLDARLRNEQRVEAELLELLESRKDAPLADLMQLRESLKTVRYEIESLTGRRQTLAHMVSLATLLVIIRTDFTQSAPTNEGFWSYLGHETGAAWTAAIRFLADAAAIVVRILVGGLPFWIVLAAVYAFLRARRA